MALSPVEMAQKISEGRLDLEMSYLSIFVIIMLAAFYTTISSTTLVKFAKCDAAQKNGMYKNLEKLLTHTMTIGITIPVAFLLGKMFNSDALLWSLFYGIMGLVGSSVALDISRKCDASESESSPDKVMAGIGVAVYGLLLLVSAFLLRKGRKAAGKMY